MFIEAHGPGDCSDKTEPTLSDVFLREDVASGERRLFATASDNRYVAAAILYDYDTNTVLSKIGGSPQGAARGEDVSLDMGSICDTSFANSA